MDNEPDYDALIESLGPTLMRVPLFQHAGTTGGFQMIHANWPAYSTGDGLVCAVSTLAEFPDRTKFFPIDWIDLFTLFVAEEKPTNDETSPTLYHVCLRDEDICELIHDGYVVGPNLIPNDPGTSDGCHPIIDYSPSGYLRLTDKGRHLAHVFDLTYDIEEDLLCRVRGDLIDSRYTDAVRRASVYLEERLREASGTEKFGQKLIDECFGEEGCLLPQAKCSLVVSLEIRAMYRRFFKYVRNEVAHGDPRFDIYETCHLLRRCSLLWKIVTLLVDARSRHRVEGA